MEIAIIILGIVIITQAVERHLFAKQMTEQLGDATKAVMSKNINEYMAAKTVEKAVKETKVNPDEVILSEADDSVFDKFIENQNRV